MGGTIISGIANAVLGNIIKQGVAKAVSKVAADKKIPQVKVGDAGPVAVAVISELAKDKVFVNATNSESWYQSGIAWGASTAIAGSLAVVAPAMLAHGVHLAEYDFNTFLPAVVTLAGAVFAMIRRFVPGMKPLFT